MPVGELEEIKARYARRGHGSDSLYGAHRNDAFFAIQQRDTAMRHLLVQHRPEGFAQMRVLEVGCGSGMNLLRFLMWGVAPENIVGADLLPERCEVARHHLPSSVAVLEGDASVMQFDQKFDVVLQSTTLSSILDDDVRRRMAAAMWGATAPGGVVLSYDFAVNNPRNPDVRKVTVEQLRDLFPQGRATVRRTTLAPPIGRRVGRWPMAYHLLAKLPPLMSHRLVMIEKT